MNLARHIIGISLGVLLLSGIGLAAEPAEVEKFVKARIDIGERPLPASHAFDKVSHMLLVKCVLPRHAAVLPRG